jgi:hypothetical protein
VPICVILTSLGRNANDAAAATDSAAKYTSFFI